MGHERSILRAGRTAGAGWDRYHKVGCLFHSTAGAVGARDDGGRRRAGSYIGGKIGGAIGKKAAETVVPGK